MHTERQTYIQRGREGDNRERTDFKHTYNILYVRHIHKNRYVADSALGILLSNPEKCFNKI